MCPQRLASPAKHTSRCAGRSDLWREGPSTLANEVRASAAGIFCWVPWPIGKIF
jgi:hypothetical protein